MNQQRKVVYICPLCPQIRQDTPGICPICGMELVVEEKKIEQEQ